MKDIVTLETAPLVAPIFIEDGETSSSIVIANNSAIPAGATVTIRSLAGSEILTFHQALAPHQQVELSLQSLLSRVSAHIPVGSITVTQDRSLNGMTVASQVLITNRRGELPAYADEELAMPSMQGSNLLRGVADAAVGMAFLAVTNIDPTPQHVTLRCLSEKREYSPVTINLAAYATSLVSSCSGATVNDLSSYLDQIAGNTDQGVKGYELRNDGLPGTIAAFGLAPHKHENDIALSAIPFTDPGLIRASDIVFAGIPFGPQPALPDGVYTPRISFTNFSSSPAHVTVSIATTPQEQSSSASTEPGNSPELRPLQQLTIPARRTTEFVLQDAESQSGLLQSLVIHTDATPGDLLSKIVSRSDGNLYEIELLGKDRMDENNGGIHPWTVEQDFVSHLLLFNYSDKPRAFGVGIWNGSILWDKKLTLAPEETREISFNQLIQDNVPDDKGQVLTPNYPRGVVNWMVPESGEGTGRLMVTSRSQALARNFSCGQFIVICGMAFETAYGGLLPVNDTLDLYGSYPQFCDEFGPNQCVGGSSTGGGSASYNWSAGTSNIVTTSSPYSQWVPLHGVGAGTGSAGVSACAGGCCSNGGGSPKVVPCPTSSSVNSTHSYDLSSQSTPPNYTGLGMTVGMAVSPGNGDSDGATINESLSASGGTCIQQWQQTACEATSPQGLTVYGPATGLNASGFNLAYPATHDVFWDTHGLISATNALSGGPSSCTIVCTQKYTCGGTSIGSYTVKYTLSQNTVNGTAVTYVDVSKTHN